MESRKGTPRSKARRRSRRISLLSNSAPPKEDSLPTPFQFAHSSITADFNYTEKDSTINLLKDSFEEVGEFAKDFGKTCDKILELNKDIVQFNHHFSSFLHALQINKHCVRFSEVPRETLAIKQFREKVKVQYKPKSLSESKSALETDTKKENRSQTGSSIGSPVLTPGMYQDNKEGDGNHSGSEVSMKSFLLSPTLQPYSQKRTRNQDMVQTIPKINKQKDTSFIKRSTLPSTKTPRKSMMKTPILKSNKLKTPSKTDRRKSLAAQKKKSIIDIQKLLQSLPLEYRGGDNAEAITKIMLLLEENPDGKTKPEVAEYLDLPIHKAHNYLNTLYQKNHILKSAVNRTIVFSLNHDWYPVSLS